ncbi:site-specific integrase [Sulfuricurvum sp.]|uniref:tyrosine-type recombinase/integrase n=1 Tax=Sulfuricurvum sp. TaxID=2025608 RepID=UPI002D762093|nr:site-specific integrase [Sulfuricurvum sp.]HZF69914.1 site-specific integrase [Sulfuricurvum sp.]
MSQFKFCRVRDGVVHLDVMIDGKRFRKSTGRKATQANLKYVEKNWMSEVERLSSKVKVADFDAITIEGFGYKSLAMNAGKRKENTNEEYKGIFEKRIIPIFGNFAIESIRPSDLKEWQTKLLQEGLSGKRVHNIKMVLSGIFKDAVEDSIIERNPFEYVPGVSQKPEEEKYPFTLDEVKMIISSESGWFKNFLAVAFFTGMRTGELMALKWRDVTLLENGGIIKVRESIRRGKTTGTKTDASQDREVDILPPVFEALKEQFKLSGLGGGIVFKHSRGVGFTDAAGIRKRYWYPMLKRLKIAERDLYNTRHTFATMMISRGEDITWVQNMLGHANSNITLSAYTKYVKQKGVKRAAFLDKVDVYSNSDLSSGNKNFVPLSINNDILKLA